MTLLKLGGPFTFGIERDEKRARLIVYNNGAEEVCRKELFSNLERFIRGDETRLFKGRLKLIKKDGHIGIEVKGEMTGMIGADDLLNYLAKAKETK